MAALPPPIPYRPIAPFQALDGASPAARAGNHAQLRPTRAHRPPADARRENQNVAQNAFCLPCPVFVARTSRDSTPSGERLSQTWSIVEFLKVTVG